MLFCLLLFRKSIICLGNIECCSASCCLVKSIICLGSIECCSASCCLENQLSVQEVQNAILPPAIQKINYLFRKYRMLFCLLLFRKSIKCLGSIECCSASCCLRKSITCLGSIECCYASCCFRKSIICLGSIECCSASCCLVNQLSVQEVQNAVLPPVVQ